MKKKPNRILISSLLMSILCVAALALVATLPGGGWWFGAQVQNTNSTSTAAVNFTIYSYDATSTPQSLSSNIAPLASGNYGLDTFSLPNNFQGSSIANSAQDIRAIVNLTNRSITGFGDPNSPSPAAGQYDGLIAAGTTLRFPLVKNEQASPSLSGKIQEKTTTIIIQNVGTTATTASATFTFPQSPPYTYYYYSTSINPGRIVIFDPINARSSSGLHPPTGDSTDALGSLTVTASQNLAGIALEHYTLEDHATVLQATRGLTNNDRDTILYAPINKNHRYDRFTGLTVQNADSGSITISVTYYFDYDQYCPYTGSVTVTSSYVASGASVTFPSSGFPSGCFATATITASGNIAAIVNEAFTGQFIAQNPGHAQEMTSYNAIPGKFATKKLSVPLFKEDSYSKATGLSVQNVGGSTAHVTATFTNRYNQTFKTNAMDIAPNKAIVLQDMRLLDSHPPAWWHGWNGTPMTSSALGCAEGTSTGCGAHGVFSVILTSDQNIVGIANESTYPNNAPLINQDKSNYEGFNLTP